MYPVITGNGDFTPLFTPSLKGHLHQSGKRVGRPRGSRPQVPQWIGMNELCGAVYTVAGPLRAPADIAHGAILLRDPQE